MRVLEAVSTNAAVRKFKKEKVRRRDILRILEAGRLCQSGKNLQPWYFIVIEDRATLDSLASLMKGDIDEEVVREAPLAIAVVSDPSSEFHVFDAARAVQSMTLVAWELGLGSCVMSGPEPPNRMHYRRRATKFLGIPSNLNFLDLMVFGYFKRNRAIRKKNRKTLGEIVFEEQFGNRAGLKR